MKQFRSLQIIIFIFLIFTECKTVHKQDDVWNYALSRKNDLKLSTYITAHTVQKMFSDINGRRETLSLLKCNGITKVYLEVYRSGLVVTTDLLKETIDFLQDNGFEVVGGIATVPGGDFGVMQDGPLTWFNWQNEKTQNDLHGVMQETAPLFNEFIIDDFICTSDTSMESKSTKGERSWSEYRRKLLTELSKSIFIDPVKDLKPDITMIIKFPQWYDRFHLFGYDLETQPALFDKVWVGTETRGQYTQRFGFVQPYEGFINYRWISSLSDNKTGGAWFDHGDCDELDFIEQAYQSVLAGAKELVVFSFDSYIQGHPGHHLLRQDFSKLADLAVAVNKNPVQGAAAYKPPNSDAGGDLYLMDYMGMFGISLIPESKYPENSGIVFLPTQAAKDTAVVTKALNSLKNGSKLVMTTGFIANVADGEKLAEKAQIKWPLNSQKTVSHSVINNGAEEVIEFPLVMNYHIVPDGADILLKAGNNQKEIFMVQNREKNVSVINTYTFSQQDFDDVGEVLLSPRRIGLLEVPQNWANTIRNAFQNENKPVADAPARVTYQQLSDGSFVIHNYNRNKAEIEIRLANNNILTDNFSNRTYQPEKGTLKLKMNPRSRIWLVSK